MVSEDRLSREAGKGLVAWSLLGLGVLGLIYVFFSLGIQAQLPSDGVLLTELSPEGVSVAVSLQPLSNRLRVGDQFVAIDNVPILTWVERSLAGAPSPVCWRATQDACLWHRGDRVVYRVARDGVLLDVPVVLRHFPVGRLPMLRFGVYVLAVVSLVICTYIMFRQPRDMAARFLFVLVLCMVMNLLLHTQTMTLLVSELFIVETGLKLFCRALLFSVALHVFLVFPVPKFRWTQAKYWLLLLHVINPMVSVLWGLSSGETPLERLLAISQSVSWIGVLMLSGAVISVIHSYVHAPSRAVRSQIRWIVWGTMLGLVPYILLTGLPEAVRGRALVSIEFTAFFVILMPLSMAVAVVRYRLLDIDVLLWRTLFYVTFSMVCGGFYLLLKRVFEELLGVLIGQPHEVTAVFVASVIAVTVFWVSHQALARRADRFLFHSKIRASRLIEQVTRELACAIHLDQLVRLLAEDVPARMGASRGVLMVLSEDEVCLELIDEAVCHLPLAGNMARWLEHGGEPILRSLPQCWVTQEWLDWMDARAVELAIPLQVGEQVVGLWGLGPREGQLSYTSADVRLVRTLARQAALAVQNARLVRSMESHQVQLEEEVQRRTEVMVADRNRLNAILQNMADPLLVTDALGRIRIANPAFENLVRRSLRKMLGRHISEVLPLPELAEAVRLALQVPGLIHSATMTLVDPTLSSASDMVLTERILRASVTALRDGSAVICVLRDITHEVEVDRMKSEFISAVSHELRTPLTSILGFAKLTHRTFERTVAPALASDKSLQRAAQRVHRNLDIMVVEGERLTNLINDVLDIAALDAGTLEWNDQLCEVPLLIERAVQQYQEAVAEKGLRLELEVAASLPLLRADPERIQQVINNILSNAIKFTDAGHITVRVWLVEAGRALHDYEAPAGGGIVVSVEDTGPGIAAAEIPRLFQRFSQGGDALLEKPRGTGLGLAICQEIILHYGGDIWVTSEEGKGSTFEFVLPVGGTEAVSPVVVQESGGVHSLPAPSEAMPFVLVAYNDPMLQDLLGRELTHQHVYRIMVAASGADVVEQARRQLPAAILLDVDMTEPSGIDVLRALQEDAQTASIPVVTLSQSEQCAQCRTLGAQICLLKPVDCIILHNALVRLLVS